MFFNDRKDTEKKNNYVVECWQEKDCDFTQSGLRSYSKALRAQNRHDTEQHPKGRSTR
jgi:hypothetical protein